MPYIIDLFVIIEKIFKTTTSHPCNFNKTLPISRAIDMFSVPFLIKIPKRLVRNGLTMATGDP